MQPHSAGEGNECADPTALYRDVLSHAEHLVVMVLSTSGGEHHVYGPPFLTPDEPQPNLPVIESVKLARPTMEGVLGVLTKPDMTPRIAQTGWGKMVAGHNKAMEGVKPQHGWHPLRLKDPDSYDAGQPREAWIAQQRRFFEKPELRAWAEQCARPLGWEVTSEIIYSLFSELVVAQ